MNWSVISKHSTDYKPVQQTLQPVELVHFGILAMLSSQSNSDISRFILDTHLNQCSGGGSLALVLVLRLALKRYLTFASVGFRLMSRMIRLLQVSTF